ncbi:VIR protein [Plasmodium vivax]|uniref:VIR protein n=1 Tax=Plasmodium vivax TaxID=5855 RepID=A0A1G4EJ53_PLAVI|nr:VIR protein [Plasmodium vivax]VUZ99766.1 PIR protein [Plasmodium vivax]
MSKNLYNFVSSLSGYEKIKDTCSEGINDDMINLCDSAIFREVCDNKNFKRNYLIAEKYLTYIKSKESSLIIENACKYFSYWVYKEMIMGKTYSYSVSTIHENIMNSKGVRICENYVEDITTEIFKNIEKLNNLHKSLIEILTGINDFDCDQAKKCVDLYNGIEDTCYLNSDNPFCIGLQKFREVYNTTMEPAENCPQYQFLPPFQERPEKSANTIATFTPLGSWVRHRLSGNKNLRNKLEKEFTASQNSSELQDIEYRVPYNSS